MDLNNQDIQRKAKIDPQSQFKNDSQQNSSIEVKVVSGPVTKDPMKN